MKLNHYKRQKYHKKIRRKNLRILKANLKDDDANIIDDSTEISIEINIEELKWLEREREAQEQWKLKQKSILESVNNINSTHNLIVDITKETAKMVTKLPFDLPYRNPFEPEFLDDNKREICHFYRKTGVCRFDIRCSRVHETPIVSDTIVFMNMFSSSSMELLMAGGDADMSLEYDDNELMDEYRDFYVDIEKELSSYGRLVTIRTARNAMRHLRGNVYVQYRNINDAVYALSQLNGRFYAGTRLAARFVTIDSWRESICGLYFRGRCPKGGICNFLHVMLNAGESRHDLFQFLNRPSSVSHRRSVYRRHRSKTCSSPDDASTPEHHKDPVANVTKPRDEERRTTGRRPQKQQVTAPMRDKCPHSSRRHQRSCKERCKEPYDGKLRNEHQSSRKLTHRHAHSSQRNRSSSIRHSPNISRHNQRSDRW